MSNFAFLQPEWPALHDAATKAEALAHPDARTACFYARRGLEVVVHWLYKHDTAITNARNRAEAPALAGETH